jgi:hypothetical protein
MNEKPKLSRRSMLKSAVGVAGAVVCAGLASNRRAFAQAKASKAAMKYQDHPNGDQMCGNCIQFEPPSDCKVVEGPVSASGYCIEWVKKT